MALDSEQSKTLMRLMMKHRRQLLAYSLSLVGNLNEAEDLLQRSSVVICEKFGQFKPSSDFVAWACRITWWEVRAAQRDFARSKVVFSDAVLEKLSAQSISLIQSVDVRTEALQNCMTRLHPRDRQFVLTRYSDGGSVEHAAKQTGRTITAAYKMLARLRRLLRDCVEAKLVMGN
jgi:RNA polymerase sigma-70 factor (ECF subfamily)